MKYVDGEDKGEITLYAMSTCGWCKKTKKLLQDLHVSYDYIDVEQLKSDEKENIEKEVKTCNPRLSYPIIKINDECITGYKETEIKEALEK